jgi:hypothetical protein
MLEFPDMPGEFNPYAAPEVITGRHVERSGYWRDRDALIMTKDAILPGRCLKCDVTTARRLKRTLSWHPTAYYVLLLLSPILYVIVALIVRKTATVSLPFCDDHVRQRRWAIAVGWLTVLSSIPVIILGTMLGLPSTLVVGIGLALILAGAFYGVIRSLVAETKKIDKQFVWLTKIHPDFLAKLPDWMS